MFVKHERVGGNPGASLFCGGKLQSTGGKTGNVITALTNFTPGQFAVAVAVELKHIVKVAQGDVPAHSDVGAVRCGSHGQVAVAWFMGPCSALQALQQQR